MNNSLYFIPILLDAANALSSRRPLLKALAQIEELGRLPGYETGYAQYKGFMTEVRRAVETNDFASLGNTLFGSAWDDSGAEQDRDYLSERELQLLAEALEGLFSIGSEPEGAQETPEYIELQLYRDGTLVGLVTLSGPGSSAFLQSVHAGRYRLALSTGRVLWEGVLSAAELEWASAFPGQALPWAADSSGEWGPASLNLHLAGGCLSLRVFPGLESGSIHIKWEI